MRETFIDRNFSVNSRALIMQANDIIAEYQEAGFTLTLRQLYYQFVSRDIIANTQAEYKKLGSVINDARLAGKIDWDAIEDRTRFLREFETYSDPTEAIDQLGRKYLEEPWDSQPIRIEVWIEKDALLGVIEPVCSRWRLPYFACRGNVSQSELYTAGKRLAQYVDYGQRALVLHLGDHDPSGIDMTRDNEDRLNPFSEQCGIEVRRVALNMDQVRRYRPPPNPAKETDSRHAGYVATFRTHSSWELDALSPDVIDKLIDAEVRAEVDPANWETALGREAMNRNLIADAGRRWGEVTRMLNKREDDDK